MDAKLNLKKLVETPESSGMCNYAAWRLELNLLLRTKSLSDVDTGVEIKPFKNDAAYADWCKKNIVAQTSIGLHFDEKIA